MRHFRSFSNIVGPKLKANDDTYFSTGFEFLALFSFCFFPLKGAGKFNLKIPNCKKVREIQIILF